MAKKKAPSPNALRVIAPIEVGTLFDQHFSRQYRDERGVQIETFTYRCRVTKVEDDRLSYETVGEPTNVVNPFKNFSIVKGGGVMNFAFNRYLVEGRCVLVKGEKLVTTLAHRLSFKLVKAEDPSTDDEWDVYLDGKKTDYHIQITFGIHSVNKVHYRDGQLEAVTFYDGEFRLLADAKRSLIAIMEKEGF